MRGANRLGKGSTFGSVRHLAVRRILLVLAALVAMLLLSPACSKESASSANAAELEEALASGKPTLAGFVSKVCACKNITPTLEELAAEYEGRCNVLIFYYSEYEGLFSQYNVTLVPTQVYFDSNGAEVERIVGVSTKEEMVNRLTGLGGA